MPLWHGSEIPPELVAAQGLRPADIARDLAALGVAVHDERIADHVQRKHGHRWVYLTGDQSEAEHYAEWGSNFLGLVRTELGLPRPERGWLYEVDPASVGELRVLVVPPSGIVSVREVGRE